MTINEYTHKVLDNIIRLETRTWTKSFQRTDLEQIIQEANNTLVKSNFTRDEIQDFWRRLLDELTISRKQANSALLAILAAAEQVIAQHQAATSK